MRTVLCSWAHPDDESFMAGAFICSLTEAGVRVVLSVATCGDAGTVGDPPVCTREQLGRTRADELRAAATILGVEHIQLHGFPDRGLAGVEAAEIRRILVRTLRHWRPDIVLTFDPNGANRHPDHVAISAYTSDAIAAAADPRWHPETGEPHAVQRLLWTSPVHILDVGTRPNLRAEPGVDFLIDAERWRSRKLEALRAHRTQRAGVTRLFEGEAGATTLRYEVFRQAWGPLLARRPETDVFAGLQ